MATSLAVSVRLKLVDDQATIGTPANGSSTPRRTAGGDGLGSRSAMARSTSASSSLRISSRGVSSNQFRNQRQAAGFAQPLVGLEAAAGEELLDLADRLQAVALPAAVAEGAGGLDRPVLHAHERRRAWWSTLGQPGVVGRQSVAQGLEPLESSTGANPSRQTVRQLSIVASSVVRARSGSDPKLLIADSIIMYLCTF